MLKNIKREYDEKLFLECARPELVFENKQFSIMIPSCSKDIIAEGADLNHCVGSYIARILKKQTYIMFLRSTEKKDKSLVTVEIKDKTIVTAHGSCNRQPKEDELKFLESYAKKLNLTLKLT